MYPKYYSIMSSNVISHSWTVVRFFIHSCIKKCITCKALIILICYFDAVVLTLGKKKNQAVFYKVPVRILWPRPVKWVSYINGTYIISKGHCTSLYTPLLQSSLNICSEQVSVFFKFSNRMWKPGMRSWPQWI